ncbi:uncharacterized protein LOC34624129 [Cyclospora cayetanensis]|uniref:Uncharacterized protein LOC34624129 n=1 Tax=Cyclospora cayetanensis TaxID=88456 RepID=A0A6P6RUC2_9EIME|nr:uncharacterized protein LOC34624129 [Cyclospora cayetanensis]
MESGEAAKPLIQAPTGVAPKRRRRGQHATSKGSGRKNDELVKRFQPSLSWLLPGAARVQRRLLPRPTRPPPPGITPLRRLGVWRRLRQGVDSEGAPVFVTLEGDIVHKPQSYWAAQRDEAILATAGIRGRGRGSRIHVPEAVPPFSIRWRAFSDVPCMCAAVADGIYWRSLIYSAPTSGGKSLVAELLIARRLLFEGVRSVVVAPHVSLCTEKAQHLQQLLGPMTLRVEAFHASANAASNWYAGIDVAVCTLEKANMIFNRLILDLLAPEVAMAEDTETAGNAAALQEAGDGCDGAFRSADIGVCQEARWWSSVCRRLPVIEAEFPVGLVCVDEIHVIGDPQRGHLLEMLLAKVLFLNRILKRPIQLVGMSATLPNAAQIAEWLDAELFVTGDRPSPLDLFVKVGSEVYAWDKTEGLQSARRLHGGRLSLPPLVEAAASAAARALAAAGTAAHATASSGGAHQLPTVPLTASLGAGRGKHASVVASALRCLREEADIVSPNSPPSRRAGSTGGGANGSAAAREHCCGWQEDAEHLATLTWETLRESRKVIIFCPTQEWTARTASFLAKALPFCRRMEAWADLLRQRAAACLSIRSLNACESMQCPREVPPQRAQQQQQQQLQQLQQLQQQALRQARQELFALPVSMLAQLLAHSPHLYVDQQTLRGREDMQWQLAQLSLIPQATMLAAIREGVAYHHAGLSGEERECVENGYRRGYLSVLCATTTLALGVNLPAARVIVRAPHVGRNELLSAARFQQMAGRAGRKGLEHRGEAYIICSADTLPHVQDLVKTVAAAASPERSSSTGTKGSVAAGVSALKGQHLCRFLLETVHVLLPLLRRGREGFSRNTDGGAFGDIAAVLLQCTLRSRQESHASLVEEAAAAVRYLHTCFLLEAEAASASPPCCAMQQQFQGPSDPWLCCSGASAHEKPAVHNSARPAPHANLANAPPELVEAAHTTPSQTCRFPLRALAFPPSTLPAPCQALLQRYPCLRSPAVLARMLQAALHASDNAEAMPDSAPLLHAAPRGPPDAAPDTTSHLPASSKHPPQSRGATGQSSRAPMLSSRDEEAFAARLRLHFSALDELAAQLEGKTHPARGRSSDVDVEGGKAGGEGGRRLALTEAGAATVEAGLAPWEGAELYADIFKTSVLGLCATNELHIIFLAAVSVGGDAQPHWRCYLSVYDSLDPACRAALSEVFSMLAGKLKLACLPVGALVSKFKDLADTQTKGSCFASNSDARRDAIVLQQFLQLEGMTPRRATALRAIQVNTCEELLNTPVYDIFKALEAAEPAFLTAADHNAEANQDAWLCKMRRQRARLLAVAVKLKDAAQKEQAMRLQALEDEAAGHWSLAEKLSEQSGDEEGSVASQQHSCLQSTDHEPTANCKS